MISILMAVFFALFGISLLLARSGGAAAVETAPDAPQDGDRPAGAAMPGKVESIINERIAQLDEKLVDLHTRTAQQLQTTVDEAEERFRQVEKDVSGRLADASAGAASGGAAPSTEDIPDIKHIMQERMEQFDAKLMDIHTKVAKRLESTAEELEEKLRGQSSAIAENLPENASGGDTPIPLGADHEAKLEAMVKERMEQFDEKLIDMHTRVARRLEEAAEEQEKKIKGVGPSGEGAAVEGGGPGPDVLAKIGELEEKLEALASASVASAGGGDAGPSPDVLAKIGELEEKVKILASAGPPASANEGASPGGGDPGDLPDLKQLMQERMEQFDAKIIDMHTRIAKRLEQAAEEQEEKIKSMGGDASGGGGGGGIPPEKIQELEEKIGALAAGGGGAPSGDDLAAKGKDFEGRMEERMQQFDEKLIDMHTRMARRLEEAAQEQEQRILTIGDDVGKSVGDRLADLEEKVKALADTAGGGDG